MGSAGADDPDWGVELEGGGFAAMDSVVEIKCQSGLRLCVTKGGDLRSVQYGLGKILVMATDGNETRPIIMTPAELISALDEQGNSGWDYAAFDVSEFGKVKPLVIKGTWRDARNPLHIIIETENGGSVAEGWGKYYLLRGKRLAVETASLFCSKGVCL